MRAVLIVGPNAEPAGLHPDFVRLRLGKREKRAGGRFCDFLVTLAARGVVQALADDAHDFHTTPRSTLTPKCLADEFTLKVRRRTQLARGRQRSFDMILHTVPVSPGLALFKVEGALDFAGAPAIQDAIAKVADDSAIARMVIDVGDVTAADDKGVASLASAVRRALARHPDLQLVAVARDHFLAGA